MIKFWWGWAAGSRLFRPSEAAPRKRQLDANRLKKRPEQEAEAIPSPITVSEEPVDWGQVNEQEESRLSRDRAALKEVATSELIGNLRDAMRRYRGEGIPEVG